MNAVPNDLARRIVERFGTTGVEWLGRLPSIIGECEQRWSLQVMSPFKPLSLSYVAPAVRLDGTDVVLKVLVPNLELLTEIEALGLFSGNGSVQLLDADPDQGSLLLEGLKPGTPLSSIVDDEHATSIAVRVMRQLWSPVPPAHPFPTVVDWAAGLKKMRERFGGGCGPFPSSLVETAERLFSELIGSMAEPMVLHGDLHHGNILTAERQPWLAIDPKGLVGEPAYEVGAILRNPMPELLTRPQPGHILARRVDQLAEELGFERARVLGWGLAQAVLAAWWSYEDHGHGWERWIACAELLSALERKAA